jgi:hypothetical protein
MPKVDDESMKNQCKIHARKSCAKNMEKHENGAGTPPTK